MKFITLSHINRTKIKKTKVLAVRVISQNNNQIGSAWAIPNGMTIMTTVFRLPPLPKPRLLSANTT